jgi:hypothetical protein
VIVSSWRAGELAPSPVDEASQVEWPLPAEALEELRWYVEDYLRVPYGLYGERGPQVAERIRGWGQALFAALFATEHGAAGAREHRAAGALGFSHVVGIAVGAGVGSRAASAAGGGACVGEPHAAGG